MIKQLFIIFTTVIGCQMACADSTVYQLNLAYRVADRAISEKLVVYLSDTDFKVSYEYVTEYRDDQPIRFTFEGQFQTCRVEVGSTSLQEISTTCRAHLPEGAFVCDKNHFFIYSTAEPIFHLFGSSKFELIRQITGTYASYGTERFEEVAFTDESRKSATLSQGRMWPYGDEDESSIVTMELSAENCLSN